VEEDMMDMNECSAAIEAILFVATKPMTPQQLASILDVSRHEIDDALATLCAKRNAETSGIHVVIGDEGVMLATNPACAEHVARCAKEDVDAELSRPSLETLTIVAYRGPLTKPEIEAIRGVNCTLILRNLLLRGLLTEEDDTIKLQPVYMLSMEALRHLGLHSVKELPEYEALRGRTNVDALLAALGESSSV
jgi:segregation and condensation protein B